MSFLVEETRSQIATTADASIEQLSKPEPEVEENRPIRQDMRSRLVPTHPAFAVRSVPAEVLRELGAGYWERQKPRMNGTPDPLNRRLVFQVRGLREREEDGRLQPVILTHTGRALTTEQEGQDGKWWTFPGFRKSLELYNLDLAILDEEADRQANQHVVLVEGCFDVAKLWAAGIRNAVATFGAHLYGEQLPRVDLLSEMLGVDRFLIWYDRDQDGTEPHGTGAVEAVALLQRHGFEAESFDWEQRFLSRRRGEVAIPAEITDPAEFSVEQLGWLRENGRL